MILPSGTTAPWKGCRRPRSRGKGHYGTSLPMGLRVARRFRRWRSGLTGSSSGSGPPMATWCVSPTATCFGCWPPAGLASTREKEGASSSIRLPSASWAGSVPIRWSGAGTSLDLANRPSGPAVDWAIGGKGLSAEHPAWAGPAGGRGIEDGRQGVGLALIVDPPPPEMGPGVVDLTGDREPDLVEAHVGGVELLARKRDVVIRVWVGVVRDADHLGDVTETGEAHPQAHPSLDGGSVRVDGEGDGGRVHDGNEADHPGVLRPGRSQVHQRRIAGVALGYIRSPPFPIGEHVGQIGNKTHQVVTDQDLRPPGRCPGPTLEEGDQRLPAIV